MLILTVTWVLGYSSFTELKTSSSALCPQLQARSSTLYPAFDHSFLLRLCQALRGFKLRTQKESLGSCRQSECGARSRKPLKPKRALRMSGNQGTPNLRPKRNFLLISPFQSHCHSKKPIRSSFASSQGFSELVPVIPTYVHIYTQTCTLMDTQAHTEIHTCTHTLKDTHTGTCINS